jgi:hypothetical protein
MVEIPTVFRSSCGIRNRGAKKTGGTKLCVLRWLEFIRFEPFGPTALEPLTFSATRPASQVAVLAISLEPKGSLVTPRKPVIYLGRF